MKNPKYNNAYTISQIIRIIQKAHPTLNIGEYVTHAPSADGRGMKAQLENGTILVTWAAIDDVNHANEIPNYTNVMIGTFKRDNLNMNNLGNSTPSFLTKILNFFRF